MGYEELDRIVLSDPVRCIFQCDNKIADFRRVSASLLFSELVVVNSISISWICTKHVNFSHNAEAFSAHMVNLRNCYSDFWEIDTGCLHTCIYHTNLISLLIFLSPLKAEW